MNKITGLMCRLGFHKDEILTLDRQPRPPWMIMHEYYIRHCQWCKREERFRFWIERS